MRITESEYTDACNTLHRIDQAKAAVVELLNRATSGPQGIGVSFKDWDYYLPHVTEAMDDLFSDVRKREQEVIETYEAFAEAEYNKQVRSDYYHQQIGA